MPAPRPLVVATSSTGHVGVPNRLTRVPPGPAPPLPSAVGWLVPIADAFMIAMLSRPATGSLRVTWVTPATYWLSVLTAIGAVAGALTVRPGPAWLAVLAMVALIAAAAGAGAVAIVGLAQRRAR